MKGIVARIAGAFRPPTQPLGLAAPRRANATALAAAMAGIALAVSAMPVAGPALAGPNVGGDDWHYYKGCSPQYRIHKNNAGCLSAWWDNTPPISTGVAGGSTFGAQSSCSDYGEIRANVDISVGEDYHFHLDDDNKIRGKDLVYNVRNISCCMNVSDLCHRQQVEAKDGQIRRYTGTGTNTEYVNVSSHERRYKYCQEHPDDIYCEVNPKGDAKTAPVCTQDVTIEGISSCTCGDRMCTVDDCDANWDDSVAVSYQARGLRRFCLASDVACDDDNSCTFWTAYEGSSYSSSLDDTGAHCTITAICHVGNAIGSDGEFWARTWTAEAVPVEDVDDLQVCNSGLVTRC